MTSGELLLRYRSEMSDTVQPYLWSDEEFWGYADDAQTTFCRKTDGIGDARTPEVTQLTVPVDIDYVELHPSILKIRSCAYASNGYPVDIINAEDMYARGMRFNGAIGMVRALVIGEEHGVVRVYPRSNELAQLHLLVFRLPLERIVDDQPFEIPEEHHQGLLLWCRHRGYGKTDAETFDKMKAEEFGSMFESYCAEAKEQSRRRQFKPRVVRYGGL